MMTKYDDQEINMNEQNVYRFEQETDGNTYVYHKKTGKSFGTQAEWVAWMLRNPAPPMKSPLWWEKPDGTWGPVQIRIANQLREEGL